MSTSDARVTPTLETLATARAALVTQLPNTGFGEEATNKRIREDVCPGLNALSKSPNYYGFVIGGVTPAARFAENIVAEYDQNVAFHLPDDTIASDVEDAALKLLCQLLRFEPADWTHRIFTTGATGSNILGLACGRQYVIEEAARRNGMVDRDIANLANIGKVGIARAMKFANVDEIQVLATVPHSSLIKAASVVGLGRDAVKLVPSAETSHKFDFEALETLIAAPRTATIIAVACAEVNAGLFATTGDEMKTLRRLCDKHGAWLHVDGAMGIMGRMLDSADEQYKAITSGSANMEHADSITGDCHKLLNVPYDCGFFLSKHRGVAFSTFRNAGAAYLSTTGAAQGPDAIQPAMNMGLENSRRLRALPVYATLLAYGREGSREMLKRQIALARRIAALISRHDGYTLLPLHVRASEIFMIAMCKANDKALNAELVKKINATGKIYVSGTVWDGEPACRFAVSNWQVDVERDVKLIEEVLDSMCKSP